MSCETCPFACTDQSEQAQNYGCLPTPFQIIQMKVEKNINWHCHDDETKLCAGFAESAHSLDLDVKKGVPGSYREWYLTGEASNGG